MFDPAIVLKLFAGSLALYSAGAVAALLCRNHDLCRRITNGLALLGTVVVFVLSLAGLSGVSFDVLLPAILPAGGGLALGLDRLSAVFLLIIAAGVIPSTFYAIGYTRHYKRFQSSMGFALNIFIPAMMLVALSRNTMTFLVFWELMSVASYFLVMTDDGQEETRRAGWL